MEHISFCDGSLSDHNPDLERDLLAESFAFHSSEGERSLIDLVTCSDVVKDNEWDLELLS